MNPQYDPRIIHMWKESRRATLCGIDAEDLERWAYELPPKTTVYQCVYCWYKFRAGQVERELSAFVSSIDPTLSFRLE